MAQQGLFFDLCVQPTGLAGILAVQIDENMHNLS